MCQFITVACSFTVSATSTFIDAFDTTRLVARSMLATQLVDCGAWIGCDSLLPALSVGPTVFRGPRNFAEFGFLPRNLGRVIFAADLVFTRNLTFFIRRTIFSQKMTSK